MSDQRLPEFNIKSSPLTKCSNENLKNKIVPPLLKEVGKLAVGVAAVNAASATGKFLFKKFVSSFNGCYNNFFPPLKVRNISDKF